MQNVFSPSVPFEMKPAYGIQSSIIYPPAAGHIPPSGPVPLHATANAYSNSISTPSRTNFFMPMQYSSNYMASPYGAPGPVPPFTPAYQMNHSTHMPNQLQYYPQMNAVVRPPPPSAPVSYGSQSVNHRKGYENKYKNSSALGNYKTSNTNSSSNSSTGNTFLHAPSAAPSESLYCEPCDKDFTTASSFEAHCKTHEPCRHPGCNFSASKKVVIAHFHGSHGLYSGSGFKIIDVEGQKFRVLLGTSPEEVAQWRAERKKKFPTAATAANKEEALAELKSVGGILPSDNTGNNKKRNRGSADNSGALNKKKKNNRNSEQQQSHYMPATESTEGSHNNDRKADNDGNADSNTTAIAAAVREEKELLGEDISPVQSASVTESVKRKNRCIHFGRGRCQNGDGCKYSHDFVPVVCPYFAKFACRNGSRCMNIHHGAKKGVQESKGSNNASNSSTTNENSSGNSNGNSNSSTQNPPQDYDAMIKSPTNEDESRHSNDSKNGLLEGHHDEGGADPDRTQPQQLSDDNDKNQSKRPATSQQPQQKASNKPSQPQKKKGGLQIPPPLAGGERGTLLRKLLESEIVAEESVVLQCLRYIVQNNFFCNKETPTMPMTASLDSDPEMALDDANSLQQ